MGLSKCDHIKWLITLTSDNNNRLTTFFGLLGKIGLNLTAFQDDKSIYDCDILQIFVFL